MSLYTCFNETTFIERQTYKVLIEKDKEVVGNKLSRVDFYSYSDDFNSGLHFYVSVGSRFVVFVLKFRNHNMFIPILNTRYA